jgi:hypothetical protein
MKNISKTILYFLNKPMFSVLLLVLFGVFSISITRENSFLNLISDVKQRMSSTGLCHVCRNEKYIL